MYICNLISIDYCGKRRTICGNRKKICRPRGRILQAISQYSKKYRPTIPDDRIDDIYHDTFIAAQKNLMGNRIRENTSWNSYLISIGLNLATHEYRKFGDSDEIDPSGNYTEDEVAMYNTPEVQRVFGRVLEFMKEKCRKILEMTLYDRLSSEEIAIELDSTPRSVITQRNRCKKRLVELVKSELRSLDYEIK